MWQNGKLSWVGGLCRVCCIRRTNAHSVRVCIWDQLMHDFVTQKSHKHTTHSKPMASWVCNEISQSWVSHSRTSAWCVCVCVCSAHLLHPCLCTAHCTRVWGTLYTSVLNCIISMQPTRVSVCAHGTYWLDWELTMSYLQYVLSLISINVLCLSF